MANVGGPPGGPIDWEERTPEHVRRIARARAHVPPQVISAALAAYEDAPPRTGLEDRMALAIYEAMSRSASRPGHAVIHYPGE